MILVYFFILNQLSRFVFIKENNMTVQKNICPIILTGGSGTRLWPISRPTMPKQFSNLFEDTSLIEKTINRLTGCIYLDPIVVSVEVSRFIVKI